MKMERNEKMPRVSHKRSLIIHQIRHPNFLLLYTTTIIFVVIYFGCRKKRESAIVNYLSAPLCSSNAHWRESDKKTN